MKRWLLRWLIDGEDVYIAVREAGSPVFVHSDFEGADADLAGRDGRVVTATMVVD